MKQTGFTLVELLVVVIIMGVLTSIAMPQYRRSMDRSKAAEAMQMLPALFEARERWMIENECIWSNGEMNCPSSVNLSKWTPKLLDIESKGTIDGSTIKTKNFTYNLVAKGSVAQACVSAKPEWGGSRGITGATIWYRGDKFTCSDTDTNHKGCDILNVIRAKEKGTALEYKGCI
ncbi:MAG: prepilin-type N-terminal cleavage/methylation domain-containing protein [Elusimicrobiaceae bacterium]|nr:prepilin-type N-terminal cleavage/methylation domain-containing protein [Elusimicrobiaceae bacterium]